MEYYDLGLRTSDPKALELAKTLGFAGAGILLDYEKGVFEQIRQLRKAAGSFAGFGLILKDPGKSRDFRGDIELIASQGRPALETREVDLAYCEELDYIMARLAKKNNVAVVFDLHPLIFSSKRKRGEILSGYFQAAKVVRKFKSPFILTSGAQNPWDLRGPSELIAFAKVLGFSESQARKALSGSLLKENRKRLGKNWIMPGVEAL